MDASFIHSQPSILTVSTITLLKTHTTDELIAASLDEETLPMVFGTTVFIFRFRMFSLLAVN